MTVVGKVEEKKKPLFMSETKLNEIVAIRVQIQYRGPPRVPISEVLISIPGQFNVEH